MICCDDCGQILAPKIIQARHYSAARLLAGPHYCNSCCDVSARKKHNLYKDMSERGREKRRAALIRSNRENPRRKTPICYIL